MTILAVDRNLAAEHLTNMYDSLADEIGQTSRGDTAAGWKGDIDQAELRMGGGGPRIAFYALCRYYALERFSGRIATRVDTRGYAIEGDRNSIFENVGELVKRQASVCAVYGYPVGAEEMDASLLGGSLASNSTDIVGTPPAIKEPLQGGGLRWDRASMNNVGAEPQEWS